MAAEIVSSLVFTPFLIRSFGQSEYGVYSLSLSITAYLFLLDLGVGNAMVRFFSKYHVEGDVESQRKLLGVSLVFYLAVAAVMCGICFALQGSFSNVFAGGLNPSEIDLAKTLLYITIANAAFTLIFSIFDKVLIAYEYFSISKVIQIIKIVFRLAIQFPLLLLGFKSVAIAASNLLLTLVFGVGCMLFVMRKFELRPALKGCELGFIKETVGYSFFVFLQMVATQINALADQVLLGMMTSAAVLGVYAVGSQLNQYLQSVASGINGVTMPGIVRLVEEGSTVDSVLAEMVKIGRLCFIVLGIIVGGFIAVGSDFVSLWAGAENKQAYMVALILMLPMMFTLIQSPGVQVLWAKGRHRLQAIIKIGVAVTNIGLTISLIKWNPLLGAAMGTAISCILGDVIAMNIAYKRDIGISIKSYYRKMLKGILPSAFLASVSCKTLAFFLPLGWLSLASEIVLALLVYGVCLWLFGMNQYEKNLIANVVDKLAKDTGSAKWRR